MLLILLVILLVLAFGGGFYGRWTEYGVASWSPLGLILLVVVILALTGNLHL